MSRRLLLILLPVLILVLPAARSERSAASGEVVAWEIDRAHSEISFKVRHLGISTVRGRFDDFEASFELDPADLSTFRTSARIDANSINTRNERRDNHLRSDDFFDAENHPTLTFESKRVENVEEGRFQVVGDLTIRGTTREVVLDAELVGEADMGDTRRVAIEAETTIDRFDYGLHWDRVTEAGGLVVGRDVTIVLEIQGFHR